MNVGIIVSQMIMLFAMMMVGAWLWNKKWMNEDGYSQLSRMVVNIFNPLLIVNSVLGKSSEGNMSLIGQNLILVVFFYALLLVFGFIVPFLVRPKKAHRKIYQLMTLFGNVGFMGIPVITSFYGNGAVIYIVFYMLGYNIFLYSYGIILARKAGEDAGAVLPEKTGGQWKKMLNTGNFASILAIIIFVFRLEVPNAIAGFCSYLGGVTIPMSMIMIGASIAKSDVRAIITNVRMYAFIAIRMIALPIILALLLKPLGFNEMVFGVFVLELAMPVGSILTLVAKENGADEACCTNAIVLSTLVSIISIPIVAIFI